MIYRKFFIFLVTSLKNECKRLEYYIIQQIRNCKQLCKDFSLSSHLVSLGLKTHDALFYSLSIFLYIFLTSFQSLFYCIEYVFLWPIKCAVIWISHSCAKFKKAAISKYFFCSIPYNPGLVNDFEEDIKDGYSSLTIFPQRIYELK